MNNNDYNVTRELQEAQQKRQYNTNDKRMYSANSEFEKINNTVDQNLLDRIYGQDQLMMAGKYESNQNDINNSFRAVNNTFDNVPHVDFLKQQGYLIFNEFVVSSKPIFCSNYKIEDNKSSNSISKDRNKKLGHIFKIYPKGSEPNEVKDEEDDINFEEIANLQ